MKRGLILLFGMPRSGTTWLGKIFDSHPDTLYRHEPDSEGRLNELPLYATLDQREIYSQAVRQFVEVLPAMNSSRVAGSLPMFSKSYFSRPRLLFQRLAVMTVRAAESVSYHFPIPGVAPGDHTNGFSIVWKSIESVGRLGLIARVLPECRAILILRHPCGYVASVLKGEAGQQFTASDPASEDYEVMGWLLAAAPGQGRVPSLEALKTLHPVERLAWRWVLTNEKALADIAGVENCMYVRYEDVCTDPQPKARELLRFAGLPWHPQVASFVQHSTTRHSNRYYSVFKEPLLAANKWQKELSADVVERVMTIVRKSALCALYK